MKSKRDKLSRMQHKEKQQERNVNKALKMKDTEDRMRYKIN